VLVSYAIVARVMPALIQEYAAVIQAILALAGIVVAVLLYIIARQQTHARRLDSLREYLREHHSREMRELRRIVRGDLVAWLQNHEHLDEPDPNWIALKSAYEDILNYYEYLGTLLREGLASEDIILRTAHNSAVAIWDIHQRFGDRIRPPSTRSTDFAGEFEYLVERAREYRKAHGLAVS
jgi:hypothetical protein